MRNILKKNENMNARNKRLKITLAAVSMSLSMTCHAQTIEQVRKEIVRQRIPHAEIVLAQARLETGNFTSRRCRVDHNLFGMKRGKRYAKYTRWQDSIRDYKERISSRYTGGNYYNFLKSIKYASDVHYINKLRKFE